MEHVGGFLCLLCYGLARLYELVERFLRFRLRWFYHDCSGHHQGKIDGGWMKTAINEPLCHIQCGDFIHVLSFVGEDALVHTRPVVRQGEHGLEALLDIIRI